MPLERRYSIFVAMRALDSTGVGRPNSPRRSEWPIRHHFMPMSTICSAAISPVYAPQPLKLQFCGAQKAPFVNDLYTMPMCRGDGQTYTSPLEVSHALMLATSPSSLE